MIIMIITIIIIDTVHPWGQPALRSDFSTVNYKLGQHA